MKICVIGSMVFIAVFAGQATVLADTEYQQAIGLIHMDSQVSGGENSLSMLAAVAKNAGADMAIVTDHDTQKATYGIWPLRKLLRVSHSRASVRKYGIEKYLDEIAAIDADLDEFDFMPGIEAVPYYRWDRAPFNNALMLRDLHRHMLVMGLRTPEQIEHLPSIEAGYSERYTNRSLLGLLWLIPLLISFIIYKPPGHRAMYYENWFYSLFSNQQNLIALPLMAASVVFLINDFPYKEPVVDQYKGDAGPAPYQHVIDYVNDNGGLVFWAHPEATYQQSLKAEQGNPLISFMLSIILEGGLEILTDPYYNMLNETVDYTGFAIFFAGQNIVGKPEGMWDSLLLQFCRGTREKPVWAISEIDMEEGTDPETASESQTVLLVREKSKAEYLDALRKGRMYCFTENLTHWVTIKEYAVTAGGKKAISGEVLTYRPGAELVLDLDIRKHDLMFDIVVVKEGMVFDQKRVTGSERIVFPLTEPTDEMGYVRLAFFKDSLMRIATNPIFLLR